MRSWILCLLILFAFALEADAREWTSAAGDLKFKASVVGIGKGAVRLRLQDGGSVHNFPLSVLSSADQKYVRDNARRYGSTGSPTDVFFAYQAALVRANSFWQVKSFFSTRQKAWWKKFDTDERKELASLKRFYIGEASVSNEDVDGNKAVVRIRGKGRVSSGKIKQTYAKFTMVKEGGAWKIDSKNISIGGNGVIFIPQTRLTR